MTASLSGAPRAGPPARGVLFMLASATIASTIGLSVRLVEHAGGWQIILYRNLAMAAVVVLYLAFRHRRRFATSFVSVRWIGVAGGACMAAASSLAVWAFLHTTIANVLFITGTMPFFAGLLGWLVLGERIRPVTWAAMAIAFAGLVIMTGEGLAQGRYFGDLLALVAMAFFAGLIVAMRAGRLRDMTPLLAIGTVLAAAAAATQTPTLAISPHDLAICVAMGAVQSFAAYLLFMVAARHLRAGEISLLTISETIFGPFWVWLAVDEVPPAATFMGGAVILVALLAQGPGGAAHGVAAAPMIAAVRDAGRLAAIFAAIASAYFLSEFFRISHAVIGPRPDARDRLRGRRPEPADLGVLLRVRGAAAPQRFPVRPLRPAPHRPLPDAGGASSARRSSPSPSRCSC